jgi:membrane protease YdiL (CAAX protease family)
LLGVGIGAALFGVHLSVITIFSGGLSFEFNPDVGFIYVGGAVTAYMLMSSMEEIAFRGYGMRLLDRRYGLWVTQIVIAALFVIYHIAGGQDWLSALVGTGLGGLLFGMAAMASRGLALPTGLHAAWNFTDWLVGGREHAGAWTLVIDEALAPRVQMVAHTSYIVVFIAATVGFWWWYRNRVEAAPV